MGFVIVLLVIVVLLAWFAIGQYNKLIALKHAVENAWGQVDIQLKLRADLIPNLMNTVKGAADYEKGTLTAVTQLRTAAEAVQSTTAAAKTDKSAAAQKAADEAAREFNVVLNSVHEAYPQLNATVNFARFQEQLTSIEEKISYARQAYNDSVEELNVAIESFPSSLFAGMAKAVPAEPYELKSDADREAPVVKF